MEDFFGQEEADYIRAAEGAAIAAESESDFDDSGDFVEVLGSLAFAL